MKIVTVILVAVGLSFSLAGCKFNTAPLSGQKTPGKNTKRDSGQGSDILADAALVDGETPADANIDAGASQQMDAAAEDSGGSTKPHRDAGGPTGKNDAGGPSNGGLKCNDVFCPFTQDPIKPCCTTAQDVEHGTARNADRCGLDFSATNRDFWDDYCWQRDQPGVVDETCASVPVDIRSEEPGCCTDNGLCGSVNTEYSLGCHYDPSTASHSCGQSVPEPDAGVDSGVDSGTTEPPNPCDPRGWFGIRVEVDLTWGGRSGGLWALTDDGRGKQVVHMLANFSEVDKDTLALKGTLKPCGVQLPTFFSTTLCEAYEPVFPTSDWDNSTLAPFGLSGHAQCLKPGCILSIDAQTTLLGIRLNNPEAPWPTSSETVNLTCPGGKGEQCFPDDDSNSEPGVRVELPTSGYAGSGTGCNGIYTKRGAPLSASTAAIFDSVRRANRLQLGVRMRIGGSAKFNDACDGARGSASAEFVNSRAWQCLVQPGTYNFPYSARAAGPNDPCTAAEAQFMDDNLPIYSVLAVGKRPDTNLNLTDRSASAGPQIRMVRLGAPGDSVSCEAVRNATY